MVAITVEPNTAGSSSFDIALIFSFGLEQIVTHKDLVLEKLQGSNYFPKFVAKGKTSSARYLVMELLGPSVSTMRRACEGRHYTMYSLLKISAEMVKCIEAFHSHGFVHRDIKPANFLIRANREHPICLIDFGLSKSYINHATGQHIPFSDEAGFTGTCRYASVHAHDNYELSRRDDMLSWFYSVIELAEGKVPWPGSKDRELTEEMKKRSRAADLCRGLPDEFIEIYRRLRALKFEETPPYTHVLSLIQRASRTTRPTSSAQAMTCITCRTAQVADSTFTRLLQVRIMRAS